MATNPMVSFSFLQLDQWKKIFSQLLSYDLCLPLAILLSPLLFLRKSGAISNLALTFFITSLLIFISLWERLLDPQTARFLAFYLGVARVLVVLILSDMLSRLSMVTENIRNGIAIGLAFLFLFQPGMPWAMIVKGVATMPSTSQIVKSHFRGGPCFVYARKNLLEEAIVLMNHSGPYVLPARRVVMSVISLETDNVFFGEENPFIAFSKLKELGFSHVLDIYYPPVDTPDYYYSYKFSRFLRMQGPKARLVEATDCVLVDLREIEDRS